MSDIGFDYSIVFFVFENIVLYNKSVFLWHMAKSYIIFGIW